MSSLYLDSFYNPDIYGSGVGAFFPGAPKPGGGKKTGGAVGGGARKAAAKVTTPKRSVGSAVKKGGSSTNRDWKKKPVGHAVNKGGKEAAKRVTSKEGKKSAVRVGSVDVARRIGMAGSGTSPSPSLGVRAYGEAKAGAGSSLLDDVIVDLPEGWLKDTLKAIKKAVDDFWHWVTGVENIYGQKPGQEYQKVVAGIPIQQWYVDTFQGQKKWVKEQGKQLMNRCSSCGRAMQNLSKCSGDNPSADCERDAIECHSCSSKYGVL